jgi:hypothetical protein
MTRNYTVGELKRIVKESTDTLSKEYKPVKYNDDNKKINDKAYKEMETATKNYDGKVSTKKTKKVNYPENYRGMETLRPQNMTPEMKKRFSAQLDGYVDEKAKKAHENDPFGNAEFGDGSLGKALDKRAEEEKKGHETAAKIGLTGSKTDFKEKDDTMFESNAKTITKLTFKRTKFLTENHMLSKVPDEYKVEGKKFIMRDGENHEYLVEWHDEPKVVNKTKINESMSRIKELFNYKSKETVSTNQSRIAEEKNFENVLGKARKLM